LFLAGYHLVMNFLLRRSGHTYQAVCGKLLGGLAGWCLCFFPVFHAFAGGKSQKPLAPPDAGTAANESNLAEETGESRGERIFRALVAAYPDRIGGIEFLDGDWTIQVYSERFYYAEGRLLPASLREKMNEYAPLPFYNYQKELPPWVQPAPEESARMREQEALRSSRQLKRSSHFYDALWRAHSRDESWERVKQIRFLGHQVLVHYSILTELSLVEEQILRSSKTSAAVRQWINIINVADSWNWRNIASSQGRSYHAYGAAIDLLPKSLGGLETYWLWTARNTPEWWAVPYSRRFHPPDEVIKAFESFGFIWGGKWRFYDTMHFEYRPEILVLSRISRTDPRELR
jgi:hypothetical protein